MKNDLGHSMNYNKMWENIMTVRISGKSEYEDSEVLYDILDEEKYRNISLPYNRYYFDVMIKKKGKYWWILNVENMRDECNSKKVCDSSIDQLGLKEIGMSNEYVKKMILSKVVDANLFDRSGRIYSHDEVIWGYIKKIKRKNKKIKKIEKRMIDLVSEVV